MTDPEQPPPEAFAAATMATVKEEEEDPMEEKSHHSGAVAAWYNAESEDDDYLLDIDPEGRDSTVELMKTTKEKERICMFRWMVAAMLTMSAAVTILAFFLLGNEEEKNFETAYSQFARGLADAALDQQQSLRDSLQSLSTEITGYAESTNTSWPYVHLPMFEAYAKGYFDHSKAEFIGMNTYVTHEERESFINWTTDNYQDWIQESHIIRYGNLDLLNQDIDNYNPYLSKKATDGFPPDDIRPYYSVRTMSSPPARAYGPVMNLNIASIGNNDDIIDCVMELKNETLVTAIKPFNALPPEEHQNFHTDSEADNPHSFMYAPIYEHVHDSESGVVGTLTSSVAWDASMQDLLPSNVKGILCVVKNNCDQSFTYRVSGQDAYYLGDGDHHDSKFDHLEVQVDLSLHSHPNYTTTPGHCQYTMHIFPTDEFKEQYETNMPAIFASVVISTFALVAIIFFIYDKHVKRRNMELITTAARSHKVVSQLFPGDMKDQVLARQSIHLPGVTPRESHFKKENSRFMRQSVLHSPMMAREYQNTTVFFGDLSGFTAWSSRRTPEQVFELLETLYAAFDVVAKRRCVFKVETIGDCYVAATGLPEPQQDHASRIARFASDCMKRMQTLTTELTVTLGPETSNLKLRVGLHSGKIIGGILKGTKSRYQLFGDTMNTASRMESTGVPGKIHASQSTADELVAAGKGSWLTPREDKIVAKGKGEMDTFFVVVPTLPCSTATSLNSNPSVNSYE